MGEHVKWSETGPALAESAQRTKAQAVRIEALTAENARLLAALRELVACKDLKDSLESPQCARWSHVEWNKHGLRWAEYDRRKPLAWDNARAVIASIGKKAPCGECHLAPGETCDVCGASSEERKS